MDYEESSDNSDYSEISSESEDNSDNYRSDDNESVIFSIRRYNLKKEENTVIQKTMQDIFKNIFSDEKAKQLEESFYEYCKDLVIKEKITPLFSNSNFKSMYVNKNADQFIQILI